MRDLYIETYQQETNSAMPSHPQSPAPLYRPYRSGSAEFQLGLRPFKPPQWLHRDALSAPVMREKRQRMRESRPLYYKALPHSIPAQQELHRRVIDNLTNHWPSEFQRTGSALKSSSDGMTFDVESPLEPLLQLSDIIEEDFMLLQDVDGKLIITAACNPYSSSGRLVASVGRGMSWAHEPVPDLNKRLGLRIDRMLGTVHPDTPCERFNWMLTPIASLFFHHDPHAHAARVLHDVVPQLRAAPERAGDILWIRVERQTLVRLPDTNAVAFSIHTYSDPLSSIVDDMESVRGMLGLLNTFSSQRVRYAELEQIKEFAIEWLEARIASAKS